MAGGVVFIDGEFVAPEEARMSIFDYGFTWSDCVYDVTSVWRGWFFKLDDHLERFERSCDGFRLTLPYTRDEVAAILAECVDRAGLEDAYVKIEVTRGLTPNQSRDLRLAQNRFTGLRDPLRLDLGRGEVPRRRQPPSLPPFRADLVERDRPALQELQPRRSRPGPARCLRGRLRRRGARLGRTAR